jgi:hypothetical protein
MGGVGVESRGSLGGGGVAWRWTRVGGDNGLVGLVSRMT